MSKADEIARLAALRSSGALTDGEFDAAKQQVLHGPAAVTRPIAPDQSREVMAVFLPVDVAPLALVAGYLGLFSLILAPAPISVLVSWLALRDLERNPGRSGKARAYFGLGMGLFFSAILVAAIVAGASG